MSLLSRCVEAAQRFDSRILSVAPAIRLGKQVEAILARNPLIVADVGAAGGVDPRWQSLSGLVRFLAFEPRSEELFSSPETKKFRTALAAEKGRRTLHITRFNQSSSLYPLNCDLLNDFAVYRSFELERVEDVEVDTLDHCLAASPGDRPDFLKVDVEGAELDVLRGGELTLGDSVIGLRIEVSFASRHVGAALFGEVDSFLRTRGYALFILNRELMIRRNQLHSPVSQPQCVWGDAVYFLTRNAFLDRVTSAPQATRDGLVAKFVATLCAHGVHDYAAEIVSTSKETGIVSPSTADDLAETVHSCVSSTRGYFRKAMLGFLFSLVIWIAALPSAKTRSLARLYLRRRAGYVFHYLWRITARGGEAEGSVSDLLI